MLRTQLYSCVLCISNQTKTSLVKKNFKMCVVHTYLPTNLKTYIMQSHKVSSPKNMYFRKINISSDFIVMY